MEHSPFSIVSTLFGNCVPSAYFPFRLPNWAEASIERDLPRSADAELFERLWLIQILSLSLSGDLRALNYEEKHFSLNLKTILNIAYIL